MTRVTHAHIHMLLNVISYVLCFLLHSELFQLVVSYPIWQVLVAAPVVQRTMQYAIGVLELYQSFHLLGSYTVYGTLRWQLVKTTHIIILIT